MSFIIRHRWYPWRETVESISPNAISPFDWVTSGPFTHVFVPIDHNRSAGFYIEAFRLLGGYLAHRELS